MAVQVDFVGPNGLMIVRFPGRSFESAHDTIEALRDNPPEGYRMTESRVMSRGTQKAGRRCNIRLTFIHTDDRIPPLPTSGAKEYFEPYAEETQRGET